MRYRSKAVMMLAASALWLSCYAGGAWAGCMPATGTVPVASPTGTEGPTETKGSVAATVAADVQHGRVLYKENCEVCHQEAGRGKPGMAPSLANKELLSAASDRFLIETIRDGRFPTAMPSFGEVLKIKDIQDIVGYLRSLNRVPTLGEALDADRTAMGDPRLGKRWFAQICTGCHGPSGEGYLGEGSGTAIGKSGFLSKASDGFIRYIIVNGRSNTPMRGFSGADGLANLTGAEIDDIISYLRVIQN